MILAEPQVLPYATEQKLARRYRVRLTNCEGIGVGVSFESVDSLPKASAASATTKSVRLTR